MINIVVCGDYSTFVAKCVDSVKSSLFNYGVKCCVNRYDNDGNKLDLIIKDGIKKIYILDRNSVVGLIEVISKIRKYDSNSIIIIIGKYGKEIFDYKMLTLDFISIDNNNLVFFVDDRENDSCMIDKKKYFIFKYRREVHKILINDINYIEKESNIKRCIIHTVNDKYYVTDSLSSILGQLGGNFCRTHQSCIINLNNIKEMKLGNNMVIFMNDDSTDMITNRMKKEVKEYIGIS